MMGIRFTISWLIALCLSYAAPFADEGRGQILYILSGLVLLFAAIQNYREGVRRSKDAADLLSLFSLSYIGGMGISCFKLSKLQTDWELITWICLFLAYMGYYLVYTRVIRRLSFKRPETASSDKAITADSDVYRRTALSVYLLTGISLAAFIAEALLLGYIPLFTVDVPHAYSYFHISGLHYFTVSCVLVPSLVFICVWERKCSEGSLELKKLRGLMLCLVLSLLIPILCVSRFQLIFAVMLALVTATVITRPSLKKTLIFVAISFIIMLPLYIFLTVERAHSIEYLNGIFEMENENMPIFISQPYIYIANNYDNFNCLVRDLETHTLGARMLFPVWALTGLKFLIPEVVSSPLYVTKTELTTLTLFYDAYYDFGTVGVALFSAILGGACGILSGRKTSGNPVGSLIYAQIASYMLLSFFTTWFSNPTTWFYLTLSFIIYMYVGGCFEKLFKMHT